MTSCLNPLIPGTLTVCSSSHSQAVIHRTVQGARILNPAVACKTVLLFCVLSSFCGCRNERETNSPGSKPENSTNENGWAGDQEYALESTWIVSEWFPSKDEKVALRVSIQSDPKDADSYHLTIELQNRTSEPLSVIKPGLQWYWSATEEVTLIGPDGECNYAGPVPSEEGLGEYSLATLAPNDVTAGSFHLHFSNYESAKQDGVYKVRYRYVPGPPYQVEALRRQNLSFWYEEIQAGDLAFYRGDNPPLTEFDRNVTISFPVEEYRFSLAEVAAGVPLKYQIEVAKDFTGTAASLDTGGAMGARESGLAPFYRLHGNGQSYSLQDIGLGAEPNYSSHPISQGRYEFEFTWDGTNWTGPSDTDQPKGLPFPPGGYVLQVRVAGFVDLPEGRRAYDLRNQVPVILVE